MDSTPRITAPTIKVLGALMANTHAELSGSDISRPTSLASGTLYPILMRLEDAGWLSSRWESENPRDLGRPRKRLYKLTETGIRSAQTAFQDVRSAIDGPRTWG